MPRLKTLFFPLDIPAGEVVVAGEALRSGTCTQFDKTVAFNAELDYLIVYLPEEM
jgi:hypothetical protein